MKHTCDVTDYGAVGVAVLRHTERLEVLDHVDIHFPPGIEMPVYDRMDARTPLDSVGIQGAIDAAHDAGGGTVWVPPGDYLIHSLELKSNVTIHLDNGACLYGSPRLDDYLLDGPMPVYTLFDESDGNGLPERRRPVRKLVWANGAENVRVTGSGCVDGQGHAFIIPWLNGNREGDHNLRPREMFALVGCRDLCLDGFSIRNASWFSVVIQGCRDVRVRDLAIRSFVGPQQDGIDLIDSSRVTISGCHIHTADDAICLKNNRPDQVLRDIQVTDCLLRTLCNAVKIGSNSSGLFENIRFSNICVYNPPNDVRQAKAAISVGSVDGGVVRQVTFDGFHSRTARCPFYVVAGKRLANQGDATAPRAGIVENIRIINSSFAGATEPALVVGHPEGRIRNLDLQNLSIMGTETDEGLSPVSFVYDPEAYPSPTMYGVPPASQLYLRDIEGLAMNQCRIEGPQSSDRPHVCDETH